MELACREMCWMWWHAAARHRLSWGCTSALDLLAALPCFSPFLGHTREIYTHARTRTHTHAHTEMHTHSHVLHVQHDFRTPVLEHRQPLQKQQQQQQRGAPGSALRVLLGRKASLTLATPGTPASPHLDMTPSKVCALCLPVTAVTPSKACPLSWL